MSTTAANLRGSNVLRSLFLDFMQMESFARDPTIFVSADGIRLRTASGEDLIDGLSGVFVTSVGHRNKEVIAAITEQLNTLDFAPPMHGTHPTALKLTELLLQIAPEGVSAVKLMSGGSEATEAAIKLARQYHRQSGHPRKYKIISRYGSYHGATMGALSAGGGRERKAIFEPLGVGFLHVHPPYCFRCPFDQHYPECGRTCAHLVGRTIEAEDPETVAAVIMEPISISSAGFVVPPPDYLKILREACDRYNVVLIFDEIITGFGRLGTMFGSEYYGAIPDITCCGKGMGGGYAPLSAILIRDSIARAFYGRDEDFVQFHHGHTFGGNPLSAAVGVAVLTALLEQKLVANARDQGERLRANLEEMGARSPIVGDVRGAGLLQGVEFVSDKASGRAFPAAARPGKIVEEEARRRGLLLRCGNDFAALAPPLSVSADDVDRMTAILAASVTAAARRLGA